MSSEPSSPSMMIRRQGSEGLASSTVSSASNGMRPPTLKGLSKRNEVEAVLPSSFVSRDPLDIADKLGDESGEQNPLTAPNGVGDENGQVEESELFDDTFTFLMTATYPGESCCGRKQEDDEGAKEGETELLDDAKTETTISRFDGVDPDAWCLPFWTGTFVICSQLFIYTVVIANVFFRDVIPPNADRWLRLAQVFAVIVTLYTQSDFIDGMFLLTERWKAFEEVTTPCKFNLSAILRVVAGNFGILATFILVMYSNEVVDLLLNFTAMEFVATLDGSAFELAAKGFLGVTLEKKCAEIQDFRYIRRGKSGSWMRIFVYGFYVILVFGAFFTCVGLQAAREVGVDNEVYIQFDDTDVAELFGISGVYHGCKVKRTKRTGGIGYFGISVPCPDLTRGEKNTVIAGKSFLYCWEHDGWVYIDEPTETPCDKDSHLMRSSLDDDAIDSNSFDILTSAQANWIVSRADAVGGEALLDSFFIDSVQSFEDSFFYCGEKGGLVRTDKETSMQRPFETLPEESLYFPTFEGSIYRDAFGLSYRPVYTRKIVWQLHRYQVVIFNGLRWEWLALNPRAFAQNISKTDECPDEDEDPDCWKVFVKHFRSSSAWRFNFTVGVNIGISDPMIFLTPGDTGVPTDELVWYEPRVVDGRVRPGKISQEDPIDAESEPARLGYECASTIDLNCAEGEKEFAIHLTTDNFPDETELFVFFGQDVGDIGDLDVAKIEIAPSPQYKFDIPENGLIDFRFTGTEVDYSLGACVPKSEQCIQVVIADLFGDGIINPGEYSFVYNGGDSVGSSNGDLFACRSYQLGDGCKNNQLALPVDCVYTNITDAYPEEVIGNGVESNTLIDFFDLENVPELDFDPFTIPPTNGGTFSSSGGGLQTQVPTFDLVCSPGETEMVFQVTTDDFPEEISILAFFGQSVEDMGGLLTANQITAISRTGNFDISDGDTVLTDLRFRAGPTAYSIGTCVPSRISCLQVVIEDLAGDGIFAPGGYEIDFGGTSQVTGDNDVFGCRSYQFGDFCLNTIPVPNDCPLDGIADLYPSNVVELDL